jgi:signal transduction histidine kinase/AraC-like DNA-binding protein/streptogramin lyase
MVMDSSGCLWLGYRNQGLDRFNPVTGELVNYQNDANRPTSIISNGVSSLLIDSIGNLWIGTWDKGLCMLQKEELVKPWDQDLHFKDHSFHYNGNLVNKVFSIQQDNNGLIWLSSFGNGIFAYHPGLKKFRMLSMPDDLETVPPVNSRKIVISPNGNLHCGNTDLVVLNSNNLDEMYRSVIQQTPFSPEKSWHSQYPLGTNYITPVIYSILKENEHVLWIGTNTGVYKFIRKRFETFHVVPGKTGSNNITASALTPEGKLYFAVWDNGIYYADVSSTDIRKVTFEQLPVSVNNFKRVTSLIADNTGNLWITEMDEGIYKYNTITRTIKHYRDVVKSTGIGNINYIKTAAKGPENSIWFGTAAGIIVYYPKTERFFYHTQIMDEPTSLSNEFVNAISFESDTVVWVGTLQGGLNKGKIIDLEHGKIEFEHFTYNYNQPGSISENQISCIFLGSNNNLWIGTANSGLNLYNRETNSFTRFDKNHGLASNNINSILEDNQGNLWIATMAGITKMNGDGSSIVNYSLALDKQIVYYNGNGCFSLDDKLIFSTRENFIAFEPGELANHPAPDQVRLTEFKINNQVLRPEEKYNNKVILNSVIDKTSNLILDYANNSFSIRFSLLDYVEPEKNSYKYKLEGFDKEWRKSPASYRQADYANLAPGNYIFRVIAENSDGVMTSQEKTLHLKVLPPWYKSVWAVVMYISILLILAFFIRRITIIRINYINEINTQKLLHEKDNEINMAKMKFFTNISHEIRTPVTLIIAPLETLYQKIIDEPLKYQIAVVLRNARKLNNLINQLMDLRRVETGNVELKVYEYDMNSFISDILEGFKDSCARKNISLEFHSAADQLLTWFDKEKMDKVLQNLLSNAMKFTPENGRIEIHTYIAHNKTSKSPNDSSFPAYAVIRVKDSGRGIPAGHIDKIFDRFYQVDKAQNMSNPVGTGIGLSIVKEYVALHHGTIHVESIPNVETVFTIKLPLGKMHFTDAEILQSPALSTESIVQTDISDHSPGHDDFQGFLENSAYTILIAEDNAELRIFLKESLAKSYEVVEAENGKEAWEIISSELPDLVISDVMMPEMDGLELTEKIKTNLKTSHLPVILLTAKSAIEDRIAGLKTGADSYIPKPFHPEHLEVRIRKLIDLRNTLRKRFSQDIGIDVETMNIGSLDAEFLNKLNKAIKENIADVNLNVENLCQQVGMSRSNMFKKLKALTDLKPTEYMRNIRLHEALHMMVEDRSLNIADVGYRVGFNSPAYFTQCFRKVYGKAPKDFVEDYLEKKMKERNVESNQSEP